MNANRKRRRPSSRRSFNLLLIFLAIVVLVFVLPKRDPSALSSASQDRILEIARQQLVSTAQGGGTVSVDEADLPDALLREAAVFVSLDAPAGLRGCMIDTFAQHESLYQNVLRNTVLAASADDRFEPITPEEIAYIRISISIVYDIGLVDYDDPSDLVEMLGPGPYGVILRADDELATYLPSVWEIFPDPAEFLSQLCTKAGLASDRWMQTPLPTINTYRVHTYSEPATNL